ncbi:MAG TPA: hypothetical protein VEW03_11625, partial [Longimicrobiaceae bacterium]|nr:hypothetical protein [Longimicrobiaceae bacterium]
MARRSNAVRLLGWALGGLALGAALAFLALNLVARSEPGRKWVLAQTLSALGKGINGKLAIARIDGNLFQGARLYGVRLSDSDGRAFIVADSAFADYDIRTLLSPRIVITRLTLYDPEIYAFKMPGDTLWNFEAIFADTTAPETAAAAPERATLVGRLRIVSGEVRVETPFEVD